MFNNGVQFLLVHQWSLSKTYNLRVGIWVLDSNLKINMKTKIRRRHTWFIVVYSQYENYIHFSAVADYWLDESEISLFSLHS